MAIKSYKTQHSEEQKAKEPIVPYARVSTIRNMQAEENFTGAKSPDVYLVSAEEQSSILRAKEQYAQGEYLTQGEMDKIVAEWLS